MPVIERPSLLKRYQNHVESLAKGMGCRLVQQPGMFGGMMYVEFGYVEGPTITNKADYLVMLHELGHFAHGHTQGRPPKQNERFYFDNGVLHSEAQAWNWALDHSRLRNDYSLGLRSFMWDICLGSYYEGYRLSKGESRRLGNGNRHHVEFVYDHPDEYFQETVKRIQGDYDCYNVRYLGRYDE